jgi:hypothetical protein
MTSTYRRCQNSGNFEDNKLKQRQRKSKCERENQLNTDVLDLIVLKQFKYEEELAADEENYLKRQKYFQLKPLMAKHR